VVKGFRNLRVGAIGARPAAFNTVRYSEKILESQGISIETLDLSEVLGRIERMKTMTTTRKPSWRPFTNTWMPAACPRPALLKMAK